MNRGLARTFTTRLSCIRLLSTQILTWEQFSGVAQTGRGSRHGLKASAPPVVVQDHTAQQRRASKAIGRWTQHDKAYLEQGLDDIPLDALHGLSSPGNNGTVWAFLLPPHSGIKDHL